MPIASAVCRKCGTKAEHQGRHCIRCGELLIISQLSISICAHCGNNLTSLPVDSKCPHCKRKLRVSCLSCNRKCPPDSKFCQKCGAGTLDLRREPTGVLFCPACDQPFSGVSRCPSDKIYLSGLGIRGMKIVKMLARGGMGAVYLGEEGGKKIAFKEMWPVTNGSADTGDIPPPVDLYLTEIEVMQALKDIPEVVRFLAAFMDEGSWCMKMEYLEGKTLEDIFLERYPYDPAGTPLKGQWKPYKAGEVAQTILPVARIVRACNERNVILRDFKPKNVMVVGPGQYRFFDFGLARLLTSKRADFKRPYGTFGYIPPEGRALPPIVPTPAFDVHTLGAMLYQLATGDVPPDEKAVPFDKVRKRYGWKFHKVSSTRLKEVIEKTLEPDPDKRKNLDWLIHALETF